MTGTSGNGSRSGPDISDQPCKYCARDAAANERSLSWGNALLSRAARALVVLSRPIDSGLIGSAVVVGMLIVAEGSAIPPWKGIAGFAMGYLLLAGTDTINDVFDLATDAISKPWRPLPAGAIDSRVAALAGGVEIALGLGVAALLSLGTLLLSAAAALVGLVYSWRLKDILIVKNATVATALVLPMAAGGIAISTDFPPLLWALFPTVFLATLAEEIHRDILDQEADRLRGRRTIPNTLPVPYPQWIIGGLYAGAYVTAWWLTRMEPLGALYVVGLLAGGLMMVRGVALISPRVDQSEARLRASFLATSIGFSIVLAGIAIEALTA